LKNESHFVRVSTTLVLVLSSPPTSRLPTEKLKFKAENKYEAYGNGKN